MKEFERLRLELETAARAICVSAKDDRDLRLLTERRESELSVRVNQLEKENAALLAANKELTDRNAAHHRQIHELQCKVTEYKGAMARVTTLEQELAGALRVGDEQRERAKRAEHNLEQCNSVLHGFSVRRPLEYNEEVERARNTDRDLRPKSYGSTPIESVLSNPAQAYQPDPVEELAKRVDAIERRVADVENSGAVERGSAAARSGVIPNSVGELLGKMAELEKRFEKLENWCGK